MTKTGDGLSRRNRRQRFCVLRLYPATTVPFDNGRAWSTILVADEGYSGMQQERRRAHRFPFQRVVSISLGNGGGEVTAVAQNVSLGGAFLHCDRLITPGSQVGLLLALSVLPLEITHGKPVRAWCVSRVVRVEPQLIEGKFGTALEFVSIDTLSQA